MDIAKTTIDWLLEGDPSIRWQTKRDLLDSRDYAADRQAIATSGWGRQLLEAQDQRGTWADGLYSPKWKSTTYTLLLLYRCGLEPGSSAALRGLEQLWEGTTYFDGGLTPAKTVPGAEACVTAMYVALARYFGYDDPRVAPAEQWLLDNQLEDGGWNCENVRSGHKHSSFHTSIAVLEALAEIDRSNPGLPEVTAAMNRGREFFLAHRLYKSHRDGSVANPVFTKLSFPPRWHYDILRGLDHFQAVTAPTDPRFGDAIAVLRDKKRSDGLWPVQHKHGGRVWFDMETGRKPSRWNTLRALRVLRWWG
ncbi:MAG: hypothetical protein GY788_13995 [bacterium]|nr:hypothetical protein [bacterium]